MSNTIYFDGKSARPQQVRVLFFNDNIHIYEPEQDLLLDSFPIAACSLDTLGSQTRIYLTEQRTAYLLPDPQQPVTGLLVEALEQRDKNAFSRLMKTPMVWLITLFLMLAVGAWFLLTEGAPRLALYFISVNQEEKLGQAFFSTVVDKSQIDSSASVTAQSFVNHLELSKNYRIKVYVVRDKEVNAFALPGGIVVINSGIIRTMDDYKELAALMGHEVTHINERHSLRSMLRQLSFSAFISVITGDVSGASGAILSNASALQSLSFSRRLEKSADREGMELLEKNHIDPKGMVLLMERLKENEHGMRVSFLSTHPLTKERIKAANRFISRHGNSSYTERADLQEYWQQLKSRVK